MRLLFIADGRSPIALNWIAYFTGKGYEVHLVSTFPCHPELRLASMHFIPIAFSDRKSRSNGKIESKRERKSLGGAAAVGLRTKFRQWMGPFTIAGAAKQLIPVILEIQPDILHAMRIPFEGMLAAEALREERNIPLVLSVWGNDFTLHARTTPWMARYTRQALQRSDALHADCQRDLHLALTWGFGEEKLKVVLPGNGGVQTDIFYPPRVARPRELETVINPRGFRAYIRNDIFFQSIQEVVADRPGVKFLCPAMADEPQAQRWLKQLNIDNSVELLPSVSRDRMAELFRQAQVAVSPSTHDGTPNTLLEAMACGCFPVAGDLESLREWITPGENGLLVDPTDANKLSQAILFALDRPDLRERAVGINQRIVLERAEYSSVMEKASVFYHSVIRSE